MPRLFAICLLALLAGAVQAQNFPQRKPQAGFAATLEISWLSERALKAQAENLADARLYLRAAGKTPWPQASAEFDARTYSWKLRVAAAGEYEVIEQFPRLGDNAPGDNTPAQQKLVVDTTAPTVEILTPALGAALATGVKPKLTYKASDDHLDPARAIDIYAADGDGVRPLGTSIPNDGVYELDVTGKVGERFTVYVVCADRAGNVSFASTTFTFTKPDGTTPILPENTLRLSIAPPRGGRLDFRRAEFKYAVENTTPGKLAAVEIMFSIDDGRTWEFGGKNASGAATGTVPFELPYAQRRSATRGYEAIRLAFIAVTEHGALSRPQPKEGDSGDMTLAVDNRPPVVFVESPFGGDEFIGGLRFDDTRGKLLVAWNAHDLNLEPISDRHGARRGPVNVYVTTQPGSGFLDASWKLVAPEQAAADVVAIKLTEAAQQACVVVTAIDELGNVGVARSGVFTIVSGRALLPARGEDDALAGSAWREAISLQKQGKLRQALAHYDKALKFTPGSAALMHDKACCLMAAGNHEDAQGLLEKAVVLGDRSPTYRYALAVVLYKRGKDDDARKQLEAITAEDALEPHIKARMLLATIHQKAKRLNEAVGLWESVVKNAPGGDDGKAAARLLAHARSR